MFDIETLTRLSNFYLQNLKLLLLEEKYLELLENRHDLEALHCLRQEIAGLPIHEYEKKRKIHHLARCVFWWYERWFIICYSGDCCLPIA